MTRYVCKDPERLSLLKKTFPWFTDELIQETLRFECLDLWNSVTFHDPELGSNEYFSIDKNIFFEQKPLETNVWYPKEMWDGNPDDLWVVVRTIDDDYRVFSFGCVTLSDRISNFMYIDKYKRDNYEDSEEARSNGI